MDSRYLLEGCWNLDATPAVGCSWYWRNSLKIRDRFAQGFCDNKLLMAPTPLLVVANGCQDPESKRPLAGIIWGNSISLSTHSASGEPARKGLTLKVGF